MMPGQTVGRIWPVPLGWIRSVLPEQNGVHKIMPVAMNGLGSCGFCGHRLWPVTGEIFERDGERFVELECSQQGTPEQCTRREFTITELFGD
jgi:hypothetical protein